MSSFTDGSCIAMCKDGLLTCLLPNECLQIEINKDLEGEYLWLHGEETLLIIEKREDLWIHSNYLELSSQPLQIRQLYSGKTCKDEPFFLFLEWIEEGTGSYASYCFPSSKRIEIGRGDCDIRYDNDYVSTIHAQIVRKNKQLWLIDMDSRNGVYVNHVRCSKQLLQLGDCIYIMGLQIIIGNDCFAINQKDRICLRNCAPYRKETYKEHHPQPAMMIYPFHGQCSVFELPLIQIQNPPTMMSQEKMPILYTLGPSMTMGVAALTSALFTLQYAIQNQQPLSSVLPTMMMSFSMVASTMLWPLLLRQYERKRDVKKEAKRRKDYQGYLQLQQTQIQENLQQVQRNLTTLYHGDIESFIQDKQSLYQYQMINEEGIALCIGMGNIEQTYPFVHQEHSLSLLEDDLLQAKERFIKQSYSLDNVPVFENLHLCSLWNVKGKKTDCHAYAAYLIMQLCITYIPNQVQIVLAYEGISNDLHPLRYLPHLFDNKQRRYLCRNIQQAQQISMYVHQSECPVIIFSCSERLSEAMHVLQLCELPNVSAFLFHDLVAHVSFPHQTLHVYEHNVHDDVGREIRWIPIKDIYKASMELANINLASASNLSFPSMYSFLRMFQVQNIEQLRIYTRWNQSDTSRSLATPIGVNAANEQVLLDVHEKAHGPHGIIAGMTGSGKSELLISMILSMSVNFHPDDVSFILIDYKGGGMAKALEEIPHIAGIITNLDGNMIQRSLNSLDSELLRRQKIFIEKAKQLQLPSIDIYTYQRLYHQHIVEEALPHLLIVADEFAELKQQQPEFMEQLIRSARIGRSLGIHLLLATQKPSGVVDDQIWSNARFHICLKVQEKADSMDMLKRDDGAKLNDTGRFFLQVGYDELFEEGQSAYAKMPYIVNPSEQREYGAIEQIDALGNIIAKGEKRVIAKQYPSTLELIVQALKQISLHHHLKQHHIWMPPLSEHITLRESDENVIALVDDPLKQRQFPLTIQLASITHILFFAMNLQESLSAIKTILYQLCKQASLSTLRIIFLDFAPIRFQECSKIPHVYAYVQGDNHEDIRYLKDYIEQELQERKEHKKQQRIVFCIHHVIAFLEVYEEWENLLYQLARDGEQYGITLLLSATSANEVRYRLLQQFTCFFVFQLRDVSDYSTILGKSLHPLRSFGRAYWKQDDLYEVQCVDSTALFQDYLKDVMDMPHECLTHLPTHVSMTSLAKYYVKETPNMVPIGIRKDIRAPYFLNLDEVWILSGDGRFTTQHMLESCYFIEDVKCIFIAEFSKDDMKQILQEKKRQLYCMDSATLSEYACASWIQEHKKEVRILWVGTGIDSIRYIFDIPMKHLELYAQDAYVIAEDLQVVRLMENI